MALTTPPPSNLGPLAQPWADWQTNQTRQNAIAIERLGGDATNDGIQNNSTLNQIASQIAELQARQSGLVLSPDVALSVPGNGGSNRTTVTIQVPRPTDSRRIGWLSVQFTASNTSSNSTEVFGSFSLDGSIFHRDSRYVPTTNLEPASWNGNKALTGYTGFFASPAEGGSLALTLEAISTDGTATRVINFTNIRVTYQYGQTA